MARVKRAVNAQKKRRTTLEAASGYRGQRSRLYRKAKEQMLHSLNYAYRDRRARKGDFRQLWITRINAAARANGMTYNRFIQGLKIAGVEVDRKVLSEIAITDPAAFAALVEVARTAVPGPERRDRGLSLRPPRPGPSPAPPGSERTPRVVAARKLLRRAGRDRTGRFLVEGAQAVREALGPAGPAGGRRLHELFVTAAAATRHPELVTAARAAGVRVVPVDRAGRRIAVGHGRPRRASWPCATCSTCRSAPRWSPAPIAGGGVRRRSPTRATLGTVIRVADAAGADAVLLAGDTVDPHNGKAVRASTGSVFHLPLARDRDPDAVLDACRAAGLDPAGRRRGRRARAVRPGGDRGVGRTGGVDLRRRGARPAGSGPATGRAPGADPDPRPRGEPQPGHRGGGLPLRQRRGPRLRHACVGSAPRIRWPAPAVEGCTA